MDEDIYCKFKIGDYELELTSPLTSLTEDQIRGATDLFLKFLRHKLVAKTEEK